MFHNEHNVPKLIEDSIKRHGADDMQVFHRKTLMNYRRQLDHIEQRLIKLIQKFH
jgi:hypothetical protein